jgi:hypothetical protein
MGWARRESVSCMPPLEGLLPAWSGHPPHLADRSRRDPRRCTPGGIREARRARSGASMLELERTASHVRFPLETPT